MPLNNTEISFALCEKKNERNGKMNSAHSRIDDHEKQVFSFSASWFSLRFIISNKTKASENKRVVFEEGNHLKRQFFFN